MRPAPWKVRPVPTVWLDYVTGVGVTDSGARVTPKITGRRKRPLLVDLLDTAHNLSAERVMLTGKIPQQGLGEQHWLITETPGWTAGGHWLSSPPTGRFTHGITGRKLEVRLASEWFTSPDGSLSPDEARQAWAATSEALKSVARDAELLKSPAATGTQLWAQSLPRTLDPEPLDPDTAELLHRTAGQHRIEHLTTGAGSCSCGSCRALVDVKEQPRGGFAYVDGRFMYAALCRELGTGPARRLTGDQAEGLLEANPYARARFHVRFAVPEGWDTLGVLPVAHDDADEGWHYPNVPGASGQTWVDGVELKIALDHGWGIEFLEGIEFTKARVLDTWSDRLRRARERLAQAQDLPPAVRAAAVSAMRAILIQGIGAFASRGRETTQVVWSARDVPAEAASTLVRHGEAFVYRTRAPRPQGQAAALYRPELAAQVWSRGRARVLECPTALSTRLPGIGLTRLGGALEVDPKTLLAVNGDAIYTTEVPGWSLPVSAGGGDDGDVGRMRLQGWLAAVKLPTSAAERNKLRQRAEAAGPDAAVPSSFSIATVGAAGADGLDDRGPTEAAGSALSVAVQVSDA